MSDEINGSDDIKKLFRQVLGSEVNIKDNIDATEEGVFTIFIKKLEEAFEIENIVFKEGGIELSKATNPLWFVIENSFKFLYGEEATTLIFWYVMDRIGDDGKIIPIEDENGKKYTFEDPKDLWRYIKYRYPQE